MKNDMEGMLIYDAIERLEEYIEDCRPTGFGGNSKKVDVEEIDSLISDIKIHIPEEMSRAQAIISEAEKILEIAQSRADEMVEQANINANGIRERAKRHAEEIRRDAELERDRMLDEHEVTLQAKLEADNMIEATKKACQDTYEHAQIETAELLDEAERCLHNCVKAVHSERDRVGVRKMQTRYESVESSADAYYAEEDPVEDESDYAEEYDDGYDMQEERRDDRREERRKRSPMKIADIAKKYFGGDDDDGMFSDGDSFDSDEDEDE